MGNEATGKQNLFGFSTILRKTFGGESTIAKTVGRIEDPAGLSRKSSAEKAAEKAAKEAEKQTKLQRQRETARLAEAESDVATRRALARAGGRSLLVATSPQGVQTLGGG